MGIVPADATLAKLIRPDAVMNKHPHSTSSLLALLLVASCSSKPNAVTVEELGVTLTVPGNWAVKKRGEDGFGISSGLDGVIVRRERMPVSTIDEARKALIVGAKIREEKKLPTGGFLFDYNIDYGTPDKPMLLREIASFITTPAGPVSCQLQLQPNQDPAPIVAACASMRPK